MNKRSKKKTRQKELKAWRLSPIAQMLHDANSSPAEVVRLEKVSAATVTNVCKLRGTSARVQDRIAALLKKPWPEIEAAARAKLEASRAAAS